LKNRVREKRIEIATFFMGINSGVPRFVIIETGIICSESSGGISINFNIMFFFFSVDKR